MVRVGLVIVGCLSLSGCATLELVSFGATGISYMVTGKSLSDHAISAVMQKDCALYRTVIGEQTCVDYQDEGIIRGQKDNHQPVVSSEDNWQIAANKPDEPLDYTLPINSPPINRASINKPGHQNYQQVGLTDNTLLNHPDSQSTKQAALQSANHFVDEPALYAVVGSYNHHQYARNNLAKQYQADHSNAHIMVNPAQLVAKGATRYRVVIGPINPAQFDESIGDVGERADHQAWRLTLCQQTLLPPPCEGALFAKN